MVASARGRLVSKNRSSSLGNLWFLLEPLLTVGVYYFIFSVVLDVSRGVSNFLLFLVVGRAAFSYHQSVVLGAAASISGSPAIMKNTTIPKAALPVGVVVGSSYQWLIDLVIVAAVCLITLEAPTWRWLLVVPVSIGMLLLNTGIGLLTSPILSRFEDLRRAMPTVYRLVFYVSGVMFPIESYIAGESYESTVQRVLFLNPVYGYIKALQWIFVDFSLGAPGTAIIVSIIWTAILFPLGLLYFVRNERSLTTFRHAAS